MFLHIFEILEIRRDNEVIIKYEFIDGKKIEIEVSAELGQVILQIDKETKNNDRRETRRHKSLSELSDKDDLIADESFLMISASSTPPATIKISVNMISHLLHKKSHLFQMRLISFLEF